jgi:diguanylate cyclase (GGDEF)-like protein
MSDVRLTGLEIERYRKLLEAASARSCLLGVWDGRDDYEMGEEQQTAARNEFEAALKSAGSSEWRYLSSRVAMLNPDRDRIWLRCAVAMGPEQDTRWLVAVIQNPGPEADLGQIVRYADLLEPISDCIGEDYLRSLTISGMAQELATRYEELNLIYGIDTFSNIEAEDMAMEDEILLQLLMSCTDYLSIDFMSLIIPEENLSIYQQSDDQPLDQVNETLQQLADQVFGLARTTRETFVVNKDNATDWTDVLPDMPYKMIVTPITANSEVPVGIIVLANGLDKQNFTNSDRKLAEVLAAEVSKVIRTSRDSLTGVLNRNGFSRKLSAAVTAQPKSKRPEVLIQVALDQFEIVNDASGSGAGDQMLQLVSAMLKSQLPETAEIGRISADEFAALLDWEIAERSGIPENIRRRISSLQVVIHEKVYTTTGRVAVVKIDDSFEDVASLMSAADVTCLIAKELGGNLVREYDKNDQHLVQHFDLMNITSIISSSLNEDRFCLYAQEIYPLHPNSDALGHYEILLRMIDEKNQIVPPGFFVPAAERYGLIQRIDRWVIQNTFKLLSEANEKMGGPAVRCSINISGPSLSYDDFPDFVVDELENHSIEAQQICFELTETTAVSNITQAQKFIARLRNLGCEFALDDFGSGMSSFGYLKELPVDYLKIDGCFVRSMCRNPLDYAMVESINNIGHVMGLKTIAEYVEDREILKLLTELKIDFGQGFGIHVPQPFTEVIEYLMARRKLGSS